MNSENSKTSDPQRPSLNLPDKVNLKRSGKCFALSNFSTYYTWKTKKSYKTNKFKISAQKWNEKFELTDGSYSASDIQHYFEYITKKYEKVADNHPTRIYINETKKQDYI